MSHLSLKRTQSGCGIINGQITSDLPGRSIVYGILQTINDGETTNVLPEKQQWPLVMMVKEAKNRTIRQQRIQMAIQEIKRYLSFGGDFDEKV